MSGRAEPTPLLWPQIAFAAISVIACATAVLTEGRLHASGGAEYGPATVRRLCVVSVPALLAFVSTFHRSSAVSAASAAVWSGVVMVLALVGLGIDTFMQSYFDRLRVLVALAWIVAAGAGLTVGSLALVTGVSRGVGCAPLAGTSLVGLGYLLFALSVFLA
jgi:hypothetical protein